MVSNTDMIMTSAAVRSSGSVHQVGGKAMGLARLAKANAAVPAWFVVTSRAFVDHLEQADLLDFFDAEYSAEMITNSGQMSLIQEKIKTIELDTEMVADIARALTEIGPGPYAVRSSMVDEDSDASSYAGQLDTYLYQHTPEEILVALKMVWASSLNAHVLSYRTRTHSALDLPVMGVVIQQMVMGDVSGVSFSSHPVSGVREHVLINAAWGLGEGIVSGYCDADEFTCDQQGRTLEQHIAKKDQAIVCAENGCGVATVSVPNDEQDIACLSPVQVAELVNETLRIATYMGCPQDVEWTFCDGQLHILQARPITALPIQANIDGPRQVFDNSNIQESYCGVTTPLTFSFAARAYHSVYNQTMSALGFSAAEIRAHDERHRHLLALLKGRIYYNINNWYRGLLLLPGFGQNKADMEQMMGLTDPVDFIEDQQLSLGQKVVRLPGVYRAIYRLFIAFRRLNTDVPDWLAQFESTYQQLDRESFKEASFSQLMDHLVRLDDEVLSHWHTPIINDFAVMIYSGQLRRAIKSLDIDDADTLLQQLLSGEEGIESTRPTHLLMQLAAEISQQPKLRRLIMAGHYAAAIERMQKHSSLYASYTQFIERYGDRTIGELKLETISLREDPSFVFDVVKNYLKQGVLDYQQIQNNEQLKRAEAEQTLRAKLSWWRAGRVFKTLTKTRSAIKHRENMRLTRTRAFGIARDLYIALGHRLHEANLLTKPRDIFYLTVEEIRDYHKGRAVTTNLKGLTELRKAEYQAYQREPVSHQVETLGPVYMGNDFRAAKVSQANPDEDGLSGIGCYPGVVEGQVKIITDPRSNMDLDGHILVAERTDPGWTPLFPACKGILVERGSTLSHSAIIARELGIPAIVGIPGLLQKLQGNEHVRLDGTTGAVTVIQPSELENNSTKVREFS